MVRRKNGAASATAKVAAKVGVRAGSKFIPFAGQALMVWDAGAESWKLLKERKTGKRRGAAEVAARIAGASLVGSEGVDWAQAKLQRGEKNPSASVKVVGGKYCVFLNGKDTGKWASTEAKAQQIAAMSKRGGLRRPKPKPNPVECSMCQGTGIVSRYAHVEGGRCFACRGSGRR